MELALSRRKKPTALGELSCSGGAVKGRRGCRKLAGTSLSTRALGAYSLRYAGLGGGPMNWGTCLLGVAPLNIELSELGELGVALLEVAEAKSNN